MKEDSTGGQNYLFRIKLAELCRNILMLTSREV